jgi:hypothetical protein
VMFSTKTVFVIGAGCSFEYGLPVGEGLKEVLIGYLRGLITRRSRSQYSDTLTFMGRTDDDGQFSDAFDVLTKRKWGEYRPVVSQMIEGIAHASSIDRYLDFNRNDPRIVEIGKLAIARAILAAEADSTLMLDQRGNLDIGNIKQRAGKNHPKEFKLHWLGELFSRIMDGGVDRSNPSTAFENVEFVCFNYDRCIEHYLFNALRAFGGYDRDEATVALKSLRIVHPYGKVGRLEWQPGDEAPAPFGADMPNSNELIELSKGIRIFTEQADGEVVEAAHAMLQGAGQVIFLGFSFLKQNMELLTLETRARTTNVYGTCFRESDQNVEVAKDYIRRMLMGNGQTPWTGKIDLPNHDLMTAGGFMAAYGNMLRG